MEHSSDDEYTPSRVNGVHSLHNGGKRDHSGFIDASIKEKAASFGLRLADPEPSRALPELLENIRVQVPGVSVPPSVGSDKWNEDLPLPLVVRNTVEARGRGVYLLETTDQTEKLRAWFSQDPSRSGNVEHPWIFQRFVECAGDRFTAYRILTDCTGATLAGGLMYSHPKDGRKVTIHDRPASREPLLVADLETPDDRGFYLDSQSIAASRMFQNGTPNSPLIGGSIVLRGEGLERLPDSHPISPEERRILGLHGLDTRDPEIPNPIEKASQEIARFLGMRDETIQSLWTSSTWIQDPEGKHHLVGVNRQPSRLGVFRDTVSNMELMNDSEARRLVVEKVFRNLATGFSTHTAHAAPVASVNGKQM